MGLPRPPGSRTWSGPGAHRRREVQVPQPHIGDAPRPIVAMASPPRLDGEARVPDLDRHLVAVGQGDEQVGAAHPTRDHLLQPRLQSQGPGPPVQAQLGFNMGHRHGMRPAGRLAGRMDEMIGPAAPSGGQERHRTGRAQLPLAPSHPRPIVRRLPAAERHQLAVRGALGAALGPPANRLAVHAHGRLVKGR